MASAAITAVFSYLHIRQSESAPRVLIQSLPAGERTYGIFHQATCIGSLTSSVNPNQDRGISVQAQGSLQTVHGENAGNATLSITADFDSGGRLYESSWLLSAAGLVVTARTKGNGPISIKAELSAKDRKFQSELLVGGAVSIKRGPDNSYSCIFTPGSTFYNRVIAMSSSYLAEQFRIIGGSHASILAACSGKGSPLDLSWLANLINSSMHGLKSKNGNI